MKTFGFKMIAMLVCMAASVVLVSCDDDDDNGNSLGLSYEKLIGKWNTTEYKSKEDGEWVVYTFDGEFQAVTLREDNTALIARTDVDGITVLSVSPWSVDATANTLTMYSEFSVYSFTGDKIEIGFDRAINSGTGESMDGEFRWVMERMVNPQPTMAERLAGGRWMFVETEEKQGEEWVKTDTDVPDVSWYEYGEDGKVWVYAKMGEVEYDRRGCWGIVNTTGAIYSWDEGSEMKYKTGDITFVDDNTFIVTYPGSYNVETGELTPGEYRDMFERVVNE